MVKDFSNRNFQNRSFKNEDLDHANFSGCDLRGADFSGSNLTGANLTHIKTGIPPLYTILIFIGALIVSLISGYFAMLAAHTVRGMLASKDENIRVGGIATIIIVILFILYSYWKGGRNAITLFVIPAIIVAVVVGIIAYVSGLGTGIGMFYQIIALLLVVVMFIVGTIARATAHSLSNIFFIITALSGSIFGKSLGGGIGTTIMAIACAQISKRALSGAKGFDTLRKIVSFITKKIRNLFSRCQTCAGEFLMLKN